MKILLIGSTGLLGQYFPPIFLQNNISFVAPTHSELDITRPASLLNFFSKNSPKNFSHIILCAAYTDVERAETDRTACQTLNVTSVQNFLAYQIPLLHFSSDYVFNPAHNRPIPENETKNPPNFYGQTKSEAESLLEQTSVDWWNIRTSWLFGHGNCFVTKIIKKSADFSELPIVSDQVGRPTYAQDLAIATTKHFILDTQPAGHYHLQNEGKPVSWADFAHYFLEIMDLHGQVIKKSANFFEFAAQRPKNSVLANTKLPKLRNWSEAIESFLREEFDQN